MLSHLQTESPVTMGAATACAILRVATDRLDTLRLDAEREIVEYARSREHIESLIDRLIVGLDLIDSIDEDRETMDGLETYGELVNEDGDELDAGEGVDEDGDTSDEDGDAVETHGRGLGFEAQPRERVRRITPSRRPAVFISWKRGRCSSAAFVPNEGAQA